MTKKEWLIIVLIGFLFGLLSATAILYVLNGYWWWGYPPPMGLPVEVLSA